MSPIQTRARARRENATPQSGLTPTRKTARQKNLKALKRRNTFFIEQAGREQAILVDRTARVNVARQAKERRKTTFHPIMAKWTDEDSLPKKSATLHPEPISLTPRVRWAPRVRVLSMSSEIAPDKLKTPAHSSGSKPLRPILIFRDQSPVKQSSIEGSRQDQPAEYTRGRLVSLSFHESWSIARVQHTLDQRGFELSDN
ncbi:hypothetical protein BD413DRAFT_617250 [Trametes elegans]|nr:hypothetical protein BD413DRAFT_617250 [Trametes elegans]